MPATAALCAAPAAAAQPPASATGIAAYVSLTSDSRNLGLSQSGGEPSLEIGLDYQHPTGFFAGFSASSVEYPPAASGDESRHRAVELYTGYNWRSPAWSATAALSRYLYADGLYDEDYDELGAGFGFRERIFFTLSYTDALLARGPSLLAAAATFAVPVPLGLEIGGTLGHVYSDAFLGGGYTHWDAGASKTAGPVTVDLRFYDNDARGYGYYGAPLPDRWVLSLSYGVGAR